MASQWIRWNSTSHIFEYSTDNGGTFNPLPLNAAILNEGSIPDATLSANVVLENVANVFTSTLPVSIESAVPIVQFKETDQAVDSRFWRTRVENAFYRLSVLPDSLGSITDIFSVNRAGQMSILQSAAGYGLTLDSNVAGFNRFLLRNSNAGSGSGFIFDMANDSGTPTEFILTSSTYTPVSYLVANGLHITHSQAGGLVLAANHASGKFRVYTGGGNLRLTVDEFGNLILSGPIYERGRSVPIGELNSYTPTWSSTGTPPAIGNGSLGGSYTKYGKTVFYRIHLVIGSTTTVTGSGSWTFTLPSTTDGYAALMGHAYLLDASTTQTMGAVMANTNTTIVVRAVGASPSQNIQGTLPWVWAAGDIVSINGMYVEA